MERAISFAIHFFMLFVTLLLSTDRKKINWKTVISGVVLQMFLGLIILKSSLGLQVSETARATFQGVLIFY